MHCSPYEESRRLNRPLFEQITHKKIDIFLLKWHDILKEEISSIWWFPINKIWFRYKHFLYLISFYHFPIPVSNPPYLFWILCFLFVHFQLIFRKSGHLSFTIFCDFIIIRKRMRKFLVSISVNFIFMFSPIKIMCLPISTKFIHFCRSTNLNVSLRFKKKNFFAVFHLFFFTI